MHNFFIDASTDFSNQSFFIVLSDRIFEVISPWTGGDGFSEAIVSEIRVVFKVDHETKKFLSSRHFWTQVKKKSLEILRGDRA